MAREARAGRSKSKKKVRKGSRGSGDTSEDSMMGITPANYNYQNQRFDADMNADMDMDGHYGEEMDSNFDHAGFNDIGYNQGGHEMAKKRRIKKKKKKKKKKPVEFEDPSLREHLLAGAYGGVAKPKVKRQGVKYTTDIDAGLRDIATPAQAMIRD